MSREHRQSAGSDAAVTASARKHVKKGLPARGHYEPSLRQVFLPGCGNCGHNHPLAMKPVPVDTTHCPRCGAAVAAPAVEREEEAVLTGYHPTTLLARALLWIGEKLHKLSMRLDP
jgi:hypothetical protein